MVRFIFCFTVFLLVTNFCVAQVGKRSIKFINLWASENKALNRSPWEETGASIPEIVMNAAEKNMIRVFLFDDAFSKAPRLLTVADFKKRITYAPEWFYASYYEVGQKVTYSGKVYKAVVGTENRSPDEFPAGWQLSTPDPQPYKYFSIIGVDSQTSQNESGVRYFHFHSDGGKYIVSFVASDVLNVLNTSPYFWYTYNGEVVNHFAGDVFLFDDNINYTIPALRKIANAELATPAEDYEQLMVRYDNNRLAELYILRNETEPTLHLDTLRLDIYKHATNNKIIYHNLGNALIDSTVVTYLTDWEKTDLPPLQPVVPPAKPLAREASKFSCTITTNIKFDRLLALRAIDSAQVKKLNALVEILYPAIMAMKLRVFESQTFQTPLTADQVKRKLLKEEPDKYDKWSSTADYYIGDRIEFANKTWEAITDNSKTQPKDGSNAWKALNNAPELFKAKDIISLDLVHKIVFDQTGKILERQPHAIKLSFFDERFYLYNALGFVKAADAFPLIQTSPESVKFWNDLFDRKIGLFMPYDSGVVRVEE